MRGADSLEADRTISEEELGRVLDSLVDEWDDRDFPRLPPRAAAQLRRILEVDP
ncbi:MAG TPA: hypothetical protein VGV64_01555 [Thermoplasmata archaeon]|nr:hypothetical protein [Thermoplasmata archaeon]